MLIQNNALSITWPAGRFHEIIPTNCLRFANALARSAGIRGVLAIEEMCLCDIGISAIQICSGVWQFVDMLPAYLLNIR